MRERMRDAVLVSPVRSAGDYSYRNTRLTGDRWLLAGDAAGFIDPIFSTGVFIAIHSGEQCADLLNEVLNDSGKRAGLFRRYERKVNRVMDMYLRFVTAWYRDEFIDVFTNPTDKLQLAPAVNAVLAGNVGGSSRSGGGCRCFISSCFYSVTCLSARKCQSARRWKPGDGARRVNRWIAVLLAGSLVGCATPHEFATPDASWKTRTGQLKFTSGERVLVGEVVGDPACASDFQMEFKKAAGCRS
jgi:hypothetical protein